MVLYRTFHLIQVFHSPSGLRQSEVAMSSQVLLAERPGLGSAGLSAATEGWSRTLPVLLLITFTHPSLSAWPGLGQGVSFSEKHPRLEKLPGNKTQSGFIWLKLTRQVLHVLKPKSLVWFA